MRITNKIMLTNSLNNINANKTVLDKLTTQLSTQKKITRASEDPIVAIRALRIKSSLNEITQYSENNISDAESWMDATETSLESISSCLESIQQQLSSLATTTYSTAQQESMVEELEALKQQIYAEGNADYSGRSLLTGYRTNTDLAFSEDDTDASYRITESFSGSDVEAYTYVSGKISVDSTAILATTDTSYDDSELASNTVYRIRLSYSETSDSATLSDAASTPLGVTLTSTEEDSNTMTIPTTDSSSNAVTIKVTVDSIGTVTCTDGDGNPLSADYTVDTSTPGEVHITNAVNGVDVTAEYSISDDEVTLSTEIPVNVTSLASGSDDAYDAAENTINYIPETGELILGDGVYQVVQSLDEDAIGFTYEKTGFEEGDLRPENYFDCIDITDPSNTITYTNEGVSQEISYNINYNQSIVVNTEAKDVFDQSIARDMDDLVAALSDVIDIENQIDEIEEMLDDEQYAAQTDYLNSMLDSANEQLTYAEDKFDELVSSYITKFDGYSDDLSAAVSSVGSKRSRLELTQSRVEEQVTNLETLQSENIDAEISDVYVEQSAASVAYEAALTAVSNLTKTSLLDFIA